VALNLKYSTALKNAKLDAITTQVGTSCLIRIYDGAQPASPDVAIGAQVLLAELTGNAAAFAGAAAAGVLTANAITADASANNTGTAAWFRILTSGAVAKIDGTVGTAGTDMIIDSTSITAGQNVACTALTITAGN
jgi:hypothetical protein